MNFLYDYYLWRKAMNVCCCSVKHFAPFLAGKVYKMIKKTHKKNSWLQCNTFNDM